MELRTRKGDVFTDLVLEIFRLNGLLLIEGDRISAAVGLSSARWKVLGAIALADRPMTVAQVSKKMGQARQSVQRIADIMADQGYFTWKENPAHKRAKLLQLTSKGKSVFKLLEASQAPWANTASDSLTLEKLECALRVLRELGDHFDE